MRKSVKQKSIAGKVTTNICYILVFLCVILSFAIKNAFYRELSTVENRYMQEVISRISLEVNNELNHHIDAVINSAQSQTIQEYLLDFEDGVAENGEVRIDLEFSEVRGYEDVLYEMQQTVNSLGNSVLFVALCSIYADNFFNNQELTGDESYSLTTRSFYQAYTSRTTYMTDPYEEVNTGKTIITIAEPIFTQDGRIIGMLLVQLSVDELSSIVTSSTFGNTGASILLDRNNNIVAYSNPQVVGMNVSDLNIQGDIVSSELANPSGQIDEYSFAGVMRTGGIVLVSELSGWKILLAMDSSEFKDTISQVSFRFNIGLFVAILIACGICARSIYVSLRPMKKLEMFMQEISEGNLSVSIEYDQMDEIGRLAEHMVHTTDSLNSYIEMIHVCLSRLGRGDLTPPDGVVFKGDFVKIGDSLKLLAHELAFSILEIRQSAEQMTQGSEQVASGAQLLANGSAEQTSSVESLNSLISNINVAIVDTALSSSSVTTDAKKISEDLILSNDKMQQLVISVQDIRSMSDEVKRIIKSIEEVAFQTNILSLNASVEAARAGSSGRGFAVVADEVRNLSIKTAEAAEETTKIINEIADAIENGTDLAQTTSKDLQTVVNEVDVFVGNISSISLSTQDQAQAITDISEGIDNISKVVMQNSAISEESAASSEELSAQSEQVLSLVERYKLLGNHKK